MAMMTGSFSSAEQSAEDDRFLDIRLQMVPIWTERSDGPWLYVEQASALRMDQPYRQRVYRISQTEDGAVVSRVYELTEPLRFAGAYQQPEVFDSLSPDSLTERVGCAVTLRGSAPDSFSGSTSDDQCKSSLRGASYATSKVEIYEDRLVTWDRGFDDAGQQVWGSEVGPYIFRRIHEDQCTAIDVMRRVAGSWRAVKGNKSTEESWQQLSGASVEGRSDVINSSGQIEWSESLRLLLMSGELYYVAKVDHNPLPIAFKMTKCRDEIATFENEGHDFPKMIRYRFVAEDKLEVDVSDGADKGFTVKFSKVSKAEE